MMIASRSSRFRSRCAWSFDALTIRSVKHTTAIGWEYMEAFRNFRKEFVSAENAVFVLRDALKKKFDDGQRNSYVLMGTHSRYPSWMVAQIYFIPKIMPVRLF